MYQELLAQTINNPVLGPTLGSMNGVGFFQRLLPALISIALVLGVVVFFFMFLSGAVSWITSGGDKAKTESLVAKVIEKNYPSCIFVGFIDGAGWYARKRDLKRLTDAFNEVFTFEESELIRFESFIKKHLSKKCYDAN